jgi:serine-type D-Ala-D-Ala carboxypeptidase/endopeptidase
MKRLFALLALASLTHPASLRAQPMAVATNGSGTQAILDERTALTPGSGIVAAMIDGATEMIYISGTSGTSRPLDERSLFEIGSVTKTVTATVLAEMVLQGKVQLSDPVAKYLPPSVRVPSRDGKSITLLDLATQHSGLPRLPSNMSETSDANPYANYSVAQLYAFLAKYKLTRDPGASFEYSNLGFGLLGLALARREHATYERLVRQNVLQPIGMDGTAITPSSADRARFAVGHDADGDVVHSWEFTEAFAGAGAIRSDLVDMMKYLRCNMGEGHLAKVCLFAQVPRATFPGHHIGLAWWTNDGSGFINHGGDTAGYHALVMMNQDRSKGVVLLSNGPQVIDIGAHMLDPQYPVSVPQKVESLSAASLDEYTGTYVNSALGLTYTVAPKNGKLYARLADQSAAAIYPSGADHFYYRVVLAYVEFVRQNGRVVGLILTQDGQHLLLYRVGLDGKPMAAKLEATYPPTVVLDRGVLESYSGHYAIDGKPTYTVTVNDGHLFFQVTGQAAYEIFPSAKDEFFFKVVDAQVSFHRDQNGNVTGVTLHQSGENIEGTRIPAP